MSYSADSCDYGGEFLTIEATDETTVKFTLCYPDPAFPSKIAFSAFPVNDTAYLEATGGGGDIVDNPIGTGPYMVENWNRGSELSHDPLRRLLGRPRYRQDPHLPLEL